MGLLLILMIITLLVFAEIAIVRTFQRRHAGARWWAALSAGWLIGGALGVWGGFFFEYQPSARLRVLGAPVPAAFFHWEGPPGEEQWVDFITPIPLGFAASNVALLALLAGCMVGMIFLLSQWRCSSMLAGNADPAAPTDQPRD